MTEKSFASGCKHEIWHNYSLGSTLSKKNAGHSKNQDGDLFLKMAANPMNGRYENISKLCFQHYKLELLMPKGHFCEKIVDN